MNPLNEIEFKEATRSMYKAGGYKNVLDCVKIMSEIVNVILLELKLIMEEEKNANSDS